jgi:YegS/Rv2252/BmrU family lipid kinase
VIVECPNISFSLCNLSLRNNRVSQLPSISIKRKGTTETKATCFGSVLVKKMNRENKLLFVYNPRSGKGQIKNKLSEILNIFAGAGYEITVRPTQCEKDAYETIKNTGANYGMIVSSGGDGTLNESFHGIMEFPLEERPFFGYIPTGSTNDFASTLSISKNPVTAAKGIVKGKKFWCDVGKASTGYFAYVAAFGAFTNVAYDTPQETKNALGHIAYILEGLKSLANLESYRVKVQYVDEDGKIREFEDEFIYGMISNTESVGGMNLLKKSEIDLQDGMFEALLVRNPENPIELQQTINALVTKDFSSDRFYFFRTNTVEFQGESEISWTLDGEYGGTLKEMKIENIAKAICMRYKPIRRRILLSKDEFED